MESSDENDSGKQGVQFVPSTGSLIGGIPKDKRSRITEAMADLQIGISGVTKQLDGVSDGKLLAQGMEAFARTCSIFLRKTVLGDFGRRETRLLDDQILETTGLRFDRLRKIPSDRRRTIEVAHGHAGAVFKATRFEDHTHEPLETYVLSAAPQEFKLSIEWPLPGTADWTGIPSEDAPWRVHADQLFEENAGTSLNCDDWLAQQVVLFDGKSISLKKMIQTVVNYDGAHSVNVDRLATPEGHDPSRASKDPELHILNAVTFAGYRYFNLIVIECAMYLYKKLLDVESIQRPYGEIYVFSLCVICSPEQADSTRPDWARFQGSMMVRYSSTPSVITHSIKAVT